MCLLFRDKVEVVYEYDDFNVRSISQSFAVPAVVRVTQHAKPPPSHTKFCRENVYLRDGYRCQYCGKMKPPRNLTFDHVQPRSRGGQTTWTNIVTACRKCNHAKGDCTPTEANMKLISEPKMPNPARCRRMLFARDAEVPTQWEQFLTY
jgi:5-methylcytosine-specific restriction endonuclease McrA